MNFIARLSIIASASNLLVLCASLAAPKPLSWPSSAAACAWAEARWNNRWALESAPKRSAITVVRMCVKIEDDWPAAVRRIRKVETLGDAGWTGAGATASAWWDETGRRLVIRTPVLRSRLPSELPALAQLIAHEIGHSHQHWATEVAPGATAAFLTDTPGSQSMPGKGAARLRSSEAWANAFQWQYRHPPAQLQEPARSYFAAWQALVAALPRLGASPSRTGPLSRRNQSLASLPFAPQPLAPSP